MACEEHLKLSSFIKNVHKDLRISSHEESVEQAWRDHLENEELLREDAETMKQLATQHWSNDTDQNSRINWIHREISQYFFNGGRHHELMRDYKFAKRKDVNIDNDDTTELVNKVRVIDVGSCYDPFSSFEQLDVLAVDIAPACSTVKKCDFSNIEVNDRTEICDNQVMSLQAGSFHAVIFCLLLEYLPSSGQRYRCVDTAVQLLTQDGLLCIVTPDSSHQAK